MDVLRPPRISVITPVFNGEKYITETIISVLKYGKDYPIEYIVIDDGSTDATAQILKSFHSSIKVIYQSNCGESAAVNTGIANALGEFILVVSDDDPLFTSKIFEGVADFFDANQGVVAWYPDWNLIDGDGRPLETRSLPEFSDLLLIGQFNCLPGPGTFFRRAAAQEIHGRNPEYRFTGDYDFWLRLSRIGRIEHRNEVVAQWRMHPESTSIQSRGYAMAQERIRVMENFLKENEVEIPLMRSALGHAYYFAARLVIFDGSVDGKRYLLKAFKAQKGWIHHAKISIVVFILCTPISSLALRTIRKLWAPG